MGPILLAVKKVTVREYSKKGAYGVCARQFTMSQKRPRSPGTTPTKAKKPALARQGAQYGFQNLARQQNTVRSGPEKKNNDVDATTTTGTHLHLAAGASTWVVGNAVQLLNGMAQGTTAVTRLGRKIQGKKLHISYTAALNPTSTQGGTIKVRVVYDKQSNGAAFAVLDYLAINAFNSANNLDNSDRFITFANHTTEPISVQNNYSVSGNLDISLDLETLFTGAGGAIANILTGSIFLIVAQDGEILVDGPDFGYYSRFRFTDQ